MNLASLPIFLIGFSCVLGVAEEQQQQQQEEKKKEDAALKPRRLVTKSLVLNNGLPWGSWGDLEYCADGSFAVDMEVKFKKYRLLDRDETALNAVKLYCATPDLHQTGYVMSTEGREGRWQGMRVCSSGFLTGMRAKVLTPQGIFRDDVAVQNLQVECDYSPEVLTGVDDHPHHHLEGDDAATAKKIPDGDWSLWSQCSNGTAICGIQVRYDSPNKPIDDAAVSDITMFCCALEELH
ncbi:vitelline membrane outer layer protein 1-like [Panulirus ornatus]|uniref:vitelline membrane outer layer protein 1-like n=1 Tax=Panulirus ornatus TaxID=150431 RepID=UPI003A896636